MEVARSTAGVILRVVRNGRRLQRLGELAELTGLSRPTVESVVAELIKHDWIVEAPPADTKGQRSPGRPARRFGFNARAGYLLGLDIGAHSIAACLGDLNGDPIGSSRERLDPAAAAGTRIAATRQVISNLCASRGVDPVEILGATAGTPGVVDPARGRVTKAPGLPGWPGTDIAASIAHDLLTCRVDLENDASLGAIGERWRGPGRDANEMIFVLLGERVGAGIITGGTLLRGHAGAAGELGYIWLPGKPKPAPGYGPLESAVSARGIAELTQSATGTARSPEEVAVAAANGEWWAQDTLRTVAEHLAQGLAPALLTLDPELVVIGGGISRAGTILLDHIRAQTEPFLLNRPAWALSTLGDEAVTTGAIRHALTTVDDEVLPR